MILRAGQTDAAGMAALRTLAGDRLGSFLLDGPRSEPDHCWAWLRGCWPDETFVMQPEPVDAPAMLPLADRYRGRPETARVTSIRQVLRWFDEADHRYRIRYADVAVAPVGVLAVCRGELRWLEGAGAGFHALAPQVIRFEPMARVSSLGDVERLSIQRPSAPVPIWSGATASLNPSPKSA